MRRITTLLFALLLVPAWAFGQASPFPLNNAVTIQSAAAATGNGTVFPSNQYSTVTFHVMGTLTSLTVTFEGSNSPGSALTGAWQSLTCYTLNSATATSTATAVGFFRCNTNGIQAVRARVSTYSSGNVTIVAGGTSGVGNAVDVPISIAAPAGFAITSGASTVGTQIKCSQAVAPTCSSACGTTGSPLVAGCDSAGVVTLGTGTMSAAPVVTFNGTWAAAPACVATMSTQTGVLEVIKAVATTTTLTTTLTGTAIAGDKYQYVCLGVAQ